MKKESLLIPVFLSLTLLTACSGKTDDDSLIFYFLPSEQDSALSEFSEEELLDFEGIGIEEIISVLSESDEEYNRYSSIPSGTELLNYSDENGILELNFSGEYSTLSGIRLTEANACIVLTFCQLADVNAVYITAEGEPMMPDGPMCADDLVLTSGEDNISEIDLLLYLPDFALSCIHTEPVQITVSEDSSPASAVLSALCESSSVSSFSFVPASSSDLMVWNDETICYVNLTQEWKDALDSDSDALQIKLACITDTLAQLDGIEYVQFLLDGAAIDDWRSVGADFPLSPDYSLVISE